MFLGNKEAGNLFFSQFVLLLQLRALKQFLEECIEAY